MNRATAREWTGLAVLTLACLLYVMDLTILNIAVPAISEDLRPSSTQLLWIIDSYGFMVAGALVTMGTLGDRIGRRRLLMIGAAAFGVTSILAAFSTTPEMLIVSRALLGVAGATIAPSTLSLIFHMFTDPKQRSVAVGIWIAAFSAGSAVGPIVGGLVLEAFWWGAAFLVALPVMALLLVLGPKLLPEYRDPDAGRLDLVSAAMSIAALLAVVYGLKQTATHGVDVTSTAVLVAGVAVGVAWVRRQRRSSAPMIDVGLFRTRAFSAALGVNLLTVFVMVGSMLFLAQYQMLVLGQGPLEAGLWSVPAAAGFVISSQLAPRLLAGVAPARVVAGGLALAAAGMGVLTQVQVDSGLGALVTSALLVSFGMGPVFGLTTELVVGSAPAEKAGAASGISETAFELGGALGIAVLGSIGAAFYRSGIDAAGLPTGIDDAARRHPRRRCHRRRRTARARRRGTARRGPDRVRDGHAGHRRRFRGARGDPGRGGAGRPPAAGRDHRARTRHPLSRSSEPLIVVNAAAATSVERANSSFRLIEEPPCVASPLSPPSRRAPSS